MVSDNGKRALKNPGINLSHHEKRSITWKILIIALVFFAVMAFGGALHFILSIPDPLLSLWMLVITFLAIGMFGIGYIVRDKLPARMASRCKRFYYMGQEFANWHWTRAQVFIADIFLVSITAAIFGWAFAHMVPLLASGASMVSMVPFLFIPMLFYVQLWMELITEIMLVIISVIAFVYEAKTWLLNKRADFCYFEGIKGSSIGMDYECDPDDVDCRLNRRFE